MMKRNRTQPPICPGQRSYNKQGRVSVSSSVGILFGTTLGILGLLFGIPVGAEDTPSTAYGSLVITWAGVIDNGEGDEPPHGPYGSLHVLVYEADVSDLEDRQQYPEPLSHAYLSGPTSAGGEKREWLDGDEKTFQNLELFQWRKPDDAVTLLIYESDPSTATFSFLDSTFRLEMKRKHDRLFFARVSRTDTLGAPVTLSSANIRLAMGDALGNLGSAGTVSAWIEDVLARLRTDGTATMPAVRAPEIPAMLVSLCTVTDGREITRDYR